MGSEMLRDEAGARGDVKNFGKIKMGVREDAHKGTFALISRAWLGSLRLFRNPPPYSKSAPTTGAHFNRSNSETTLPGLIILSLGTVHSSLSTTFYKPQRPGLWVLVGGGGTRVGDAPRF